MTREDIIRMAREAGGDPLDIERFAALVAAAERRKCAVELAAQQAQINAFYLGTPEARLLAMTKERDALKAMLAAEREACAQVCEDEAGHLLAAAIRARGQE
jgi:hypothetical protein